MIFKKLIVLISRGITGSVQRDLDAFCKEVGGRDFNIREVTKGGFTQARAKLKAEAFAELNDNVNETFYQEAPYLTWDGMRVLGADGFRLRVPEHKSTLETFGAHRSGPDAESKKKCMALGSFLYDTLNLTVLDAQIEPYNSSERAILRRHLLKVRKGDLLLLDRGYHSLPLLFELVTGGIEFCVRLPGKSWPEVNEFIRSGKTDEVVTLQLQKRNHSLFKGDPELLKAGIRCRLIRIDLENGQCKILCTSLLDQDKYSYDALVGLYDHRWGTEESFKLFKARVEIENFSGKTALAVRQDFYAKVFMMSLCSVLAFPIEDRVRNEHEQSNRKHPSKLNRTHAYSMLRSSLVGLLLKRKIDPGIKAFDDNIFQTREIIRPGRALPRKKRRKNLYYMNYKRL